MKKCCFKILWFFIFTFVAFGFKANAIPFIPKLYFSGGLFTGTGGLHGGNVSNDVSSSSFSRNVSDNGFLISAGIIPINLPVPVLGGLRVEAQYAKNFNKSVKGDMLGVGLYYDMLKFIPIVNPYIGASLMYYNAKVDFNYSTSGGDDFNFDKKRIDQPLTTFSVGLNVNIPFFPLQGFGEYRYTTSQLFSSNIKSVDEVNNYNVKADKYKSSAFLLGFRYYII